jgi:hypothetical protein
MVRILSPSRDERVLTNLAIDAARVIIDVSFPSRYSNRRN